MGWVKVQTIYYVMVLLLMATSSDSQLKYVSAKFGRVNVVGYGECKMLFNGHNTTITFNSTYNEVPGLNFGLIEYACDGETGKIISKVECMECGFYCPYNELIPSCKSKSAPYIIGAVIAIIIMIPILILVLVFKDSLYRLICNIMDYISYIIHLRRDKRKYRKTKKIINHVDVELDNLYDDSKTHCPILDTKISETREAFKEKLRTKRIAKAQGPNKNTIINNKEHITLETSNEEVEPSTSENKSNDEATMSKPRSIDRIYPSLDDENIRRPIMNMNRNPYLGLAVFMLPLFFFPGVLMCDETLFVTSTGKICREGECTNMYMYNIILRDGQIICFRDTVGEKFTIKLSGTTKMTRYRPVYRTSAWKLKVESYSSCKGTGECWNGGCHMNYRGIEFKEINESIPHGYGCDSDAVGCDTWCYYQTSCVYYNWQVEPVGQLYTVYKKTSSIYQTTLVVTYNNITTRHSLNTNNPSINLNLVSNGNTIVVPLHLVNKMHEDFDLPNSILSEGNKFWPCKSSEVNMPESDIIGDYQIELISNKALFNMDRVRCKSSSCSAKCNAPESKVARYVKSERPNSQYRITRNNENNLLELKLPIMSQVTIMLGNIDLDSLQVTPALCKLNVEMTYGCKGCNQYPYAIIKSYDVVEQGQLEYTSNCTFNIPLLTCSDSVYSINLIDLDSAICWVYLPSTNQTLYIRFDYIFTGKLDPSKLTIGESSGADILRSVVSKSEFWTSLISSLSMFTFIGLASAITVRILRIYEIKRLANSKD